MMTTRSREVRAPSPEAAAEANSFSRRDLSRSRTDADLAASLSRSAAEAAFREDRIELRVQLLRLRATVVEMLQSYKDLSPEGGRRGPHEHASLHPRSVPSPATSASGAGPGGVAAVHRCWARGGQCLRSRPAPARLSSPRTLFDALSLRASASPSSFRALSLIDQTIAAFEAEGIECVGVMQGLHPRTDRDQPVQVC